MRVTAVQQGLSKYGITRYWYVLWGIVLLVSGCSHIKLTNRSIDKPPENNYQTMYVSVALSETADIAYVRNRFIKELEKRELQALSAKPGPNTSNTRDSRTAILEIDEIDRDKESFVRYRQFPRTSLTLNHGRMVYEKPFITLRSTLIDSQSGQTVFQAEYVTAGQWYDNSAEVAASLASVLVKQLEREGFIVPKTQ